MNYTSYILKKQPINPSLLISDTRGWRELTTAAVLPASVVGFVFVAGLLPVAFTIDLGRGVKLRYYKAQMKRRRLSYISCVLRSLDHEPDKDIIQLLIAA
jgi:hypothetical protein